MKYPKILLACPTAEVKDYCFEQWADNVKSFTYPNLEVLIVDNSVNSNYHKKISKFFNVKHIEPNNETSRELITKCQNYIRSYLLDNNFDFLFSLESDIFPPKNIIEHLLNYHKNIVGNMYFFGQAFESRPIFFEIQDFGLYRQSKPINLKKAFLTFDGKLKKVYQLGLGCILIHRGILKKIKFRVDLNDEAKCHSDSYFHEDLNNLNIPCYMDTVVIPEHKNLNWYNLNIKF